MGEIKEGSFEPSMNQPPRFRKEKQQERKKIISPFLDTKNNYEIKDGLKGKNS